MVIVIFINIHELFLSVTRVTEGVKNVFNIHDVIYAQPLLQFFLQFLIKQYVHTRTLCEAASKIPKIIFPI